VHHLHSINLATDYCDPREQLGHALVAARVICVTVRRENRRDLDLQAVGLFDHPIGVRRVDGGGFARGRVDDQVHEVVL
jgi:hypothetical protein